MLGVLALHFTKKGKFAPQSNPLMKYIFRLKAFALVIIFCLSAILTYAQKNDAQSTQNTDPRLIPQQPKTLPLNGPVVVNFTERAEYSKKHPVKKRKRFIEQEEDRDEDLKHPPLPITSTGAVTDWQGSPKGLIMSPAPTASWNGVMQTQQLIPPDIRGAASSGNWVMETTNEQFNIYNKTGTLLSQVDISTFFSGAGGNGFFDPHIMYDNNYNHFLLVIDGNINSNGDGGLFLAVSQTNDPTGNWYLYSIDDGDNSSSDLLDYPLMGYNNNWVVLTATLFQTNTTTAEIYVMNRASLYSGTRGTVSNFTDNQLFVIGPAQTYDLTQNTEYLVTNANGNPGNNYGYMNVGTITGTATAPVYTSGNTIGINQPWDESNVAASQSGGNTIESGDTRIGNVVYANGTLWFTHNVFLPAGNPTREGVDWWQINPSTLTTLQFGRIQDASNSKFYYYPSINVNANGDAILGYCESSSGMYVGSAYSFHASTDAAGTMESDTVYKPGVANYYQTLGGGRNRWGDFTGAAVDPSDNSFWLFSEWANTNSKWATVVAHVPAATIVHVPPTANFTANVTTTCLGTVQFTDLSSGSPTSWVWSFGDGSTSTSQNPSHHYTSAGTFTVTLIATNTYGSNTKTATNYITITEPAGPSVTGGNHCGTGTVSLSAGTSSAVSWYDSTGTRVSTSNPFVTPSLTHTTTYWVDDTVASATYHVGPADSTIGTGGFLTANHNEVFTVNKAGTLVSIYVHAGAAGSRTFAMLDGSSTVLASKTVTLTAGGNRVTLNFDLPVGGPYYLGVSSSTINLYRNNAGAVYPYTDADGIVSITGNDAGGVPAYYYFSYDWIVKEHDCVSQRVPVTATITNGLTLGAGSTSNPTCNGLSNGSATVSVSGGTPNYTYSWSNGQSTATAINLPAGTYNVTITDVTGCSTTTSKTITQPSAINVSVTSTNAGCGASTGSATATVSGGTPTYSYSWNTGGQSSSISNVAAGTYTLTVTDSHLCTSTATAVVTGSGALNLIPSSVNVSCYGGNNGTATVSVSGGSGTLVYSWSTGASAASVSNLAAGTYTVTVHDGAGCSATASRTISQPTDLSVTLTPNDAGCGASNGSVTAVASGGTANYSYSWNTGGQAATLNNVGAGTYTVTVTDNHSCTTTGSAIVNASGNLTLATSATDVSCFGGTNGTASINVTGGTNPINYHWSTGSSATTITNLAPGTYTVTITDAAGCSAIISKVVGQPAVLGTTVSTTSTTCGTATGTATATVTGGTSAYTYAWSVSGAGATISNLAAGTYRVTVTDNNGCTTSASATIASVANLASNTSTVNVTCNGGSNGTASVSVTSGNGPFTYVWSSGATTPTATNLAAGTYRVTITDVNNCQKIDSVVVSQPNAMSLTVVPTQPLCHNVNSGSAIVSVSGGSPNYTYTWSTGTGGSAVNNLYAGNYTVVVVDGHGCSASSSFVITDPAAIVITPAVTNIKCNGDQGGSIQANVTGGTLPLVYNWNNGQTTSQISNLNAGTYTVTVTDNHNCTATSTTTITQPSTLQVYLSSTPDLNNSNNGTATVDSVTGGVTPYQTYHWSSGQSTTAINNLAAGTYTITVTDRNGCNQTASVVVNAVTGISNVSDEIGFTIHPNPATSDVIVTIDNLRDKDTQLNLHDVLGQRIISIQVTSTVTTLNLKGVATGIYFVEIEQGSKKAVKKLLVTK